MTASANLIRNREFHVDYLGHAHPASWRWSRQRETEAGRADGPAGNRGPSPAGASGTREDRREATIQPTPRTTGPDARCRRQALRPVAAVLGVLHDWNATAAINIRGALEPIENSEPFLIGKAEPLEVGVMRSLGTGAHMHAARHAMMRAE